MKKSATIFIVLASINICCSAQTLKTSLAKDDGKVKASFIKTRLALITSKTIVTEGSKPEVNIATVLQAKHYNTDSLVVDKSNAIDKVQNDKQRNSIQKKEIRELRNQRINKAILNLAQIFNYL